MRDKNFEMQSENGNNGSEAVSGGHLVSREYKDRLFKFIFGNPENREWTLSLYNAVNGQAIASNGQNKVVVSADYTAITKNEDGTYTGSLKLTPALPDITVITPQKVVCCNYDRYNNGDGNYVEKEVEFTSETADGSIVITFTVPVEIVDEFTKGEGLPETPTGATGFDFYYGLEFNGGSEDTYYSTEDVFVIE